MTNQADPVIVSIDQGTTNTKAVAVDQDGQVRAIGSAPVGVSYPQPGWVEQDAELIWDSVQAAVTRCLADGALDIAGVALSTQRESVVAWRRSTGTPIGPVLGWQDQRTAAWCSTITSAGAAALVSARTGLRIDAMFSAPKIRWLLRHRASGLDLDDVAVGTIDAWLTWRLTGGRVHACDAGNASRTLLYDVVDLAWSAELCTLFEVPVEVLPEVRRSDDSYGEVRDLAGITDGTPIVAVLADSHAALFGQGCTTPGLAKATYGTGTSVMTAVAAFVGGDSPVPATLAWLTDQPTYAREGNILSSGSTLAWTADLLGLEHVSDLVALAAQVDSSAGVIMVPAFSGLGAPHWDRSVQASVNGLRSGSTRAHVARAAVEAVAHQVCDIVEVIEADGEPLTTLRADGGATASELLMQTQADLLDRRLEVADVAEVSALGAAQLGWSGLGHPAHWAETRSPARSFEPRGSAGRDTERDAWRAQIAWSRTRSR